MECPECVRLKKELAALKLKNFRKHIEERSKEVDNWLKSKRRLLKTGDK